MTAADRERWDAKYLARPAPTRLEPPEWLVQHASTLTPGRALDLACGHGHAAIWLAERGWRVTAIDISPTGLAAAQQLAKSYRGEIEWVTADLDSVPLGGDQYDLITVFRFLDRRTLPSRIMQALRPGGTLLYETFLASESISGAPHVRNPDFVLRPEELPNLFGSLQRVVYREQTSAVEPFASLVAIKPIAD